jgi:hypothetical protein
VGAANAAASLGQCAKPSFADGNRLKANAGSGARASEYSFQHHLGHDKRRASISALGEFQVGHMFHLRSTLPFYVHRQLRVSMLDAHDSMHSKLLGSTTCSTRGSLTTTPVSLRRVSPTLWSVVDARRQPPLAARQKPARACQSLVLRSATNFR